MGVDSGRRCRILPGRSHRSRTDSGRNIIILQGHEKQQALPVRFSEQRADDEQEKRHGDRVSERLIAREVAMRYGAKVASVRACRVEEEVG